MKSGKTLTELAQELETQKARRKDYVIDSRELTVLTGENGTELALPNVPELAPTQHFHRQMGQHLKIRSDLYDRLRHTYPSQFDGLVNGMLREQAKAENKGKAVKRMIRTYADDGNGGQGIARALLSDRYRRIDNFELAETVLPIIGQIPEVQIPVCEVTETRMYISVVAPLVGVDLNDLIDPSRHVKPEGIDVVQAGFVLTNSEVGAAALSIEHMLYRLVCLNGLIVGKAMKRNHVGGKITESEDYSIYTDETLQADDKALMLKVRDAVKAATDETRFHQLAQQFADTKTTEKMVDPVEAMQVLGQRVGLTEGEGKSVLQHLITGGDLTQFGAINAITRAAHDVESYDRSIEMQQIGAVVMDLSPAAWHDVAVAA